MGTKVGQQSSIRGVGPSIADASERGHFTLPDLNEDSVISSGTAKKKIRLGKNIDTAVF